MNLDNAELMTDDELDDVGLGNYLIPRHAGIPASAALTLSFSNLNLDDTMFSLKVPAGTLFRTASSLEFQVKVEINIAITNKIC